MESYIKFETISLKNHSIINEKWIQEKIQEDPGILGLGELLLRQSEKVQQTGGRLDMLLQDDESNTRYAVELQLGKTDESHIVRTIEYWDNERKRNRKYNYVAVIIAEDITNRFFNVISLFNGSIPIIAIQMKAIKFENRIGLHFTKVLDLITPDDEYEFDVPADRAYREKRAHKDTLRMVDKLMEYISEFADGFTLKYNRHYIGLTQNNIAKNFTSFRPMKSKLIASIRLEKNDENDEFVHDSDLDKLSYTGQYRFRLKESDLTNSKDILIDLLKKSYESFTGNKVHDVQGGE